MTDEEFRILTAVAEGRMGVNESGRYVIDGDKRPVRKARESLQTKGYILWPHYSNHKSRITTKGQAALDKAQTERSARA